MQKTKQGFFRTLLGKLFCSFVLTTLFPVLLMGLFSSRASDQALQSALRASQERSIRQLEQSINMFISQILHIVNLYDMNERIEEKLTRSYDDAYTRLKEINALESEMRATFTTYNLMNLSCVLVGRNGLSYSNLMTGTPDYLSGDAAGAWRQAADAQPSKLVWLGIGSPAADSGGRREIVAVKRLRSVKGTASYGYLMLGIDERYLYRLYQELSQGENHIFLMDGEGRIVSHPDQARLLDQADPRMLERAAEGKEASGILEAAAGRALLITRKISYVDWYVVNTVPLTTVFAASGNLQRSLWTLCAVLLALCLVLALVFNKMLFTPIHSLVNRALGKHMARDTLSTRGILRMMSPFRFEYGNIVHQLEEVIEQLWTEQENKRKAELDALQMQINPHFLYNTLGAVKCLVWSGQTERIEPTINALMALLDRTMRWKEDFITIAQELDYLRQYIYIHEIRMQRSISLRADVPPELLGCLLPKMILQPIVENALFHGIVPGRAPVITITVSSQEADIRVEVLDNGRGIPSDRLEGIRQEQARHESGSFCGIGISNVAQRLRLYFGERFAFTIRSIKGQGTLVILRLTRMEGKEVEAGV
ncbi:MAG: histidine kinase [Candidatus Limiplasma sp.]|nr:histidine kinase [Candidatus Limiplasma sp.]